MSTSNEEGSYPSIDSYGLSEGLVRKLQAENTTEYIMNYWKELFDKLDTNKNGTITSREVQRHLGHLDHTKKLTKRGFTLDSPKEIAQKVITEMDTDMDGGVQFEEFVSFLLKSTEGHHTLDDTAMQLAQSLGLSKNSIRKIKDSGVSKASFVTMRNEYEQLDRDHDGALTVSEVKAFLKKKHVAPDVMEIRIHELHLDDHSQITFEEYTLVRIEDYALVNKTVHEIADNMADRSQRRTHLSE